MKYYKFYKNTYLKKIANTLTSEQITKVYTTGYPVDGPMFVPCEFISDELYKECKDFEEMNEVYTKMQEEICRQEGFCHLYNPYSVMY